MHALLLVGTIATILPFAWLVRSAFMTGAQIFSRPPALFPHPFIWRNFPEALTSQPFGRYFLNTLVIEVLVVSGTVLTTSFAAFSFARLRWRGRNLVFGLLLTSVMLPYAASLIPTFLMWTALGAVNTYVPLTVPAWFGGAGGGVFSLFLLRQFLLTIPREIDDAAYVDGASPLKVYWYIMLPLSKPALAVVGIFSFIGVWNDLLNPLIYLNDDTKYTLALGLSAFQGLHSGQWSYLMAAATAITIPVIILFIFLQKYFIRGITVTGLK